MRQFQFTDKPQKSRQWADSPPGERKAIVEAGLCARPLKEARV